MKTICRSLADRSDYALYIDILYLIISFSVAILSACRYVWPQTCRLLLAWHKGTLAWLLLYDIRLNNFYSPSKLQRWYLKMGGANLNRSKQRVFKDSAGRATKKRRTGFLNVLSTKMAWYRYGWKSRWENIKTNSYLLEEIRVAYTVSSTDKELKDSCEHTLCSMTQ